MTAISQLQKLMIKENLSMLYYDDPLSVSYLTHLESEPHERVLAALVFQDELWMIVPELEKQSAKQVSECNKVLSYRDEQSPWKILSNALSASSHQIDSIGISEDSLTVARYHALQDLFPSTLFRDSTELLQNMRVIKNAEEIEVMKQAGALADLALEVGMNALRTGVTEEEVVALIEYEMKKQGVHQMSFSTMVLFGDHAASPHGTPGKRRLKADEWVLFDLGVVFNGYTSDVTRTVVYGSADEEQKAVYAVVKQAQADAQQYVQPGVTASDIDSAARTVIDEAGYGEYFTHRLGHGLGKSVHEYPNIAPNVSLAVQEGMCFSIEPGIYIENNIGIRIEDCVYVTPSGAIPFTQTTKDLIELPIKLL